MTNLAMSQTTNALIVLMCNVPLLYLMSKWGDVSQITQRVASILLWISLILLIAISLATYIFSRTQRSLSKLPLYRSYLVIGWMLIASIACACVPYKPLDPAAIRTESGTLVDVVFRNSSYHAEMSTSSGNKKFRISGSFSEYANAMSRGDFLTVGIIEGYACQIYIDKDKVFGIEDFESAKRKLGFQMAILIAIALGAYVILSRGRRVN